MATLAEIADGLEARALQLWEEGKHEAAWQVLLSAYDTVKGIARLNTLQGGLTVKQRAGKLRGVEHTEKTRRELSERFTRGKNPNMVAARAAGMPSLRALAEHLGCSASFLSQVAAGDRPMPADKAAAFKKLTGKDWQ